MPRSSPLLAAAIAASSAITGCRQAHTPAAVHGASLQSAEVAAQDAGAAVVAVRYLRDLDSLIVSVERLDHAVTTATRDSAAPVRARFGAARRAYKRVEYLVEHFTPGTADGINGPALPDMAEDDPNRTVIPPEGFQVVEEYLYPTLELDERAALRGEVGVLLANVRRARYNAAATVLTDEAVFDAVRLEVARIVTLGLAGFDSPLAQRSITEGADALQALGDVLATYRDSLARADQTIADTLAARFARGEATLRAGAAAGFDRFDRLAFVVDYANPISEALLRAQHALSVPMVQVRRAWRPASPTPFAADAFDPLFFAPAPQVPATVAQAALGEALFFDPVLSRGARRACATCHAPLRGFADGRRTSIPVNGEARGVARNAPTVVNSALQGATFSDLRTAYLEDQVADVVRNADEMHGSLEEATAAVAARTSYARQFDLAFPGEAGPAVTSVRVQRALAAYLRSLVALDARFDRYVRGDRGAMSAEERDGFNLFMGKGKCGTCHFAPLFNGAVPPRYEKTESEVIGVPSRPVTRGARIDTDSGRSRITRLPLHAHAFKTPTLRNVALTAPYMHNGVYRTLEEVIDFYDRGGGAGIGIALPNQTLPPDPLHLTRKERRALTAFLMTLTDTTSIPGMQGAEPRDPVAARGR